MSIFALIIFSIILILITFYIIVYIIYPGAGNDNILNSITELNVHKDILTSDVTQRTLLGGAGSTIMGFIYLKDGDRTVKMVDSFNSLIKIVNNWSLEISPSISGKSHSSVRLRVLTNQSGVIKDEIIELPHIPKQKWVFIAILRDGRRFDVIYDNKIVASQRLEYYPVIISSPLSIGNTALNGTIVNVIINSTRLTPTEVERERLKYVDTNNVVLESKKENISFPGLKLFAECPSGLPCNPVTQPPSNNLLEWRTPYA